MCPNTTTSLPQRSFHTAAPQKSKVKQVVRRAPLKVLPAEATGRLLFDTTATSRTGAVIGEVSSISDAESAPRLTTLSAPTLHGDAMGQAHNRIAITVVERLCIHSSFIGAFP